MLVDLAGGLADSTIGQRMRECTYLLVLIAQRTFFVPVLAPIWAIFPMIAPGPRPRAASDIRGGRHIGLVNSALSDDDWR
uniref:hypothetical protein n=1 Tax=Mycolicibacterium mengxianglii TaxID=2736649 RepID=UPI0038CC1455